jgi:outer membrane protein TolC
MRTIFLGLLVVLAGCASGPAPAAYRAAAPEEPAETESAVDDGGALAGEAPGEAVDLAVDVRGAVEIALERNPDLGVAAARILAAQQGVDEAKAALAPTFGVSASATGTNDPVLVFMQRLRQKDLTLGGDLNNPGESTNVLAAAKVGWRLYDGGRNQARVDLARMGSEMLEEERESIVNGLKASVIDTSLLVFMAAEFLTVAEDSVGLVEEQLKISRSRFDAGAAQRSDVLSVEVRLAQSREEVVRAGNARERALTALRTLLGLTAEEPFTLTGAGSFRVPAVPPGNRYEMARANRPELRQAVKAVDAAEREIEMAKGEYLPTLDAFAAVSTNSSNLDLTENGGYVTGGLELNWPLFEGGVTKARVAAARARLMAAKETERKVLIGVESDVRHAELALTEARERLAVSEKSEEQAVEALELIRARYETGAATITEYLDAEVALTGARVRNLTARFDVERATADLRRALGICEAGMPGSGTSVPGTEPPDGKKVPVPNRSTEVEK